MTKALPAISSELIKATALVLRTCREDMTSKNGFVWPQVGEVATAADWDKTPECGKGLHGWLYGQGEYDCSNYLDETAKWLVVEVEQSGIVMLGGKCKFQSGTVRLIGNKKDASDYLIANESRSATVAVIGASVTVGDNQAAIVGALGTATAGYRGTATAGDSGTATAGDSGTATAGYSGTATAGYSGTICIRFYDRKENRYRVKIGYIGEDGLLPRVAYRLDEKNEFIAVVS